MLISLSLSRCSLNIFRGMIVAEKIRGIHIQEERRHNRHEFIFAFAFYEWTTMKKIKAF